MQMIQKVNFGINLNVRSGKSKFVKIHIMNVLPFVHATALKCGLLLEDPQCRIWVSSKLFYPLPEPFSLDIMLGLGKRWILIIFTKYNGLYQTMIGEIRQNV